MQITQCANDHTECDDSTKFVSGLATPSIITASEGGGIPGDYFSSHQRLLQSCHSDNANG